MLCHMAANMLIIGKPPFNVPQFTVFPYLSFHFYDPKSFISVLIFPPFKISLNLEFKSAAPQGNLKWRFYCSY